MTNTALEALRQNPNLLSERSRVLGEKYLETYSAQIAQIRLNFHEGKVFAPSSQYAIFEPENWMERVVRQIPEVDLSRFEGHGITKGNEIDRLQSLFLILVTFDLQGYYSKLAGSGYIDACTHGSFLIVSKIDQHLADQGNKTKIGCVVVNAVFEPMLPSFRDSFTNVTFISATEFTQWVENQKKRPLARLRRRLHNI